MTGCVRKYFELLHGEEEPEKRVEDIIGICTEDVGYGGYRPDWVEPADSGLMQFAITIHLFAQTHRKTTLCGWKP